MTAAARRPRLGFLGTGWIGRHRLQAMLETGLADAAGIADPDRDSSSAAAVLVPGAREVASLEALMDLDLDGLVIATPSALHADQAIRALDAGVPVFCQKPLGRSAEEVAAVVAAARRADRLLGLDMSYRETAAVQAVRHLVATGALGRVFAADLLFHNAYGPDKPWFRDRALAGGGCVMDLGVHLVDLALWTLDFPTVERVEAHLSAAGAPLPPGGAAVEDHAVATLTLAGGGVVRIACSWNLHAGTDAIIAAGFHGTEGGAAVRNLDGSFYDFTAERFRGTARETLAGPPDDWGGRAAAGWVRQLARSKSFDPSADRFIEVARVLDRIYAAGAR